jgi:hypothetical protein
LKTNLFVLEVAGQGGGSEYGGRVPPFFYIIIYQKIIGTKTNRFGVPRFVLLCPELITIL